MPQIKAVQNITGRGRTLRSGEKCIQGAGRKSCEDISRKIQEHSGDIKIDFEVRGLRDMDWIHVAHDKDWWRAPVITVMEVRAP
jgi:hypothetical protein